MDMQDILAAFASEPLFTASEKFLKYLGVKTSTQTADPIPFLEMYEDAAKDAGAEVPKPIKKLFGRVAETFFIGSVDDDTLHGGKEGVSFQVECQNQKYEGMFVFAVRMKDGEELTRTDAALLTRGINRLVHQQPAIVLILEDTLLSVATCERTPYKQTWRPGEKLGKVSILKGVNCLCPHRGHLDILSSMSVKGCKTFDALYTQWQKVFNTSILTNKFYNELFNWYVWAIDPKTDVYFPNDPDDDNDDYEGRDTKIIRLITRVMFVWFIKVKGLVPDRLFDAEFLKTIIKDFDPTANDCGTYYNAILQNLFFATLNRAVEDEDGKRGFATSVGFQDAKNLYRYDELFTISKEKIVEMFSEIPFVNGSLFECLDKNQRNDGVAKVYYGDGFSRNASRVPSTNHYRYRAFVPNNLFFDPNHGLFTLFDRYNFTIEENTPMEQQVALDPELLGKVFENLLGVFNPETQETARKQSGSFYTPREIVDYMVDQTLISYLGDTPLVRKLFSEEFEYKEIDWAEYQTIAAKLKTVKVLDPACGSGAFPVGMLNRIVEILLKLRTEGNNTFKLKRHIIENCIYGGDIQCIAAQITKLRFFISLIVNCEKDLEKPNFGIPELPNLETKFVAANSLISVKADAQRTLWDDPEVDRLKEELRQVRHDHFNARTARQKRSLVKKDAKLRQQLSDRLNGSFFQPKDAQQLADWNPYDQNTSAGFFDPEWMFGVRNGFDIVIGNPPYGASLSDEEKKMYRVYYPQLDFKIDTYVMFLLRSRQFLKQNGICDYIIPNTFLDNSFSAKTRELLLNDGVVEINDLTDKVFSAACVHSMIFAFANANRGFSDYLIAVDTNTELYGQKVPMPSSFFRKQEGFAFNVRLFAIDGLLQKLNQGSVRLQTVLDIRQAIKTGNDGKYIGQEKAADNYKPILRGKDVRRYTIIDPGLFVDYGKHLACPRSPEIFEQPKILIREAGERITASLDEDNRYIMSSLYNAILIDPRFDIRYLLGLINSQLFQFLMWKIALEKTKGAFTKAKIFHYYELPIKCVSSEKQNVIKELVDKILLVKRNDPEADTYELERDVDKTVYGLYGLTEDEIAVVEAASNKAKA